MTKYRSFERVKEYPDKPIYQIDMKQFQPLIVLNRKLSHFDTLDLKKVGYKKIRGMLMEIANGKELSMPAINTPAIIYRGRKFSPDEEEICNKDQFWYPQKKHVKKRGRVNKKEEIIFYGATSFYSIFSEIDIKVGDTLVLSEIELINNHTKGLIQLGFTKEILKKLKISDAEIKKMTSVERELFDSPLLIDKIPISDHSESLLFLNFFSKYMSLKREDNDFYKITNAIAEIWFNDENLAGIAYPNIDTGYFNGMNNILLGYNIAIRPNDADELYTPRRVWILKLHSTDKNNICLQILKSSDSVCDKGDIKWSDDPYSNSLPVQSKKITIEES